MLRTPVLLLALLLASGCDLYFGDGPGDPPCAWGSGGDIADPAPSQGLRNPETGACEYYGGGGGGGGGCETCGGCDDSPSDREAPSGAPLPSWGYCESACTGLAEGACLAADGCRGIYEVPTAEGAEPAFVDCWQTDFSGPVAGACDGLDAWSCSTRDDCAALHWNQCGGGGESDGLSEPSCLGSFEACAAEPDAAGGCYSDAECQPGTHCTAAEECLPPPGCDADAPCPDVCYGHCVPDEPVDPGSCDGEVACRALPPECPTGTTPGIANLCWTGYCIPLDDCDVPPPACSELASESSCVARPECSPLYEGVGCSCDVGGCTCDEWIYDRCAAM